MNLKIRDFNIGDITVEWQLTNGELHDFHVYKNAELNRDYIEITQFLDEAALNEIIEQIIDRSHESGAYSESFEPDEEEGESA